MTQAILLALPGTSSPDAMQTLRRIEARLARRFDGLRRLWAYTSSGVRRKLALRGTPAASPPEALASLRQEGVTHVAVKALHLAPGMEYTELRTAVEDARQDFERISLSKPLLDAEADFERTVRCLLDAMPPDPPVDGESLLLVAHGSRTSEAQGAYVSAAALCKAVDRRILLGVMLATPGLAEVVRTCKTAGIQAVRLMPLMIAAGVSARTELAGDGPDSWKSVLESHGIRCRPRLDTLGDSDRIVDIWCDDIGRMLAEMAKGRDHA
jgi:sirohydrochlorin cobaltochelatase